VEQQHFSPNGMRVLVPLLQAYPKYCLHEVLFARLDSLPLDEAYQQMREMRAHHPLSTQSCCQSAYQAARLWLAGALHPRCRLPDRGDSSRVGHSRYPLANSSPLAQDQSQSPVIVSRRIGSCPPIKRFLNRDFFLMIWYICSINIVYTSHVFLQRV